jgi:hypothetical protein
MRTREMRASLQGHADLVRRIEDLEHRVAELEQAKTPLRKAAPAKSEK